MIVLLMIVLCLFSTEATAADHVLRQGADSKVQVPVDIEKGAMILLPRPPLAVTGRTLPNFQVEVIGDKVMVTPLKLAARTNLFIDFGESTIATLELVGVAGGGEDLINLVLGQDQRRSKPKAFERISFPTDLKFLAGAWKVLRIGQKSTLAGISLKVNDGLVINNYILLNFSLTYKGDAVLTVNDVQAVIETLGGLAGKTVLDSQVVPSTIQLQNARLTQGETSSGTIILPRVELDHDQVLALKVAAGNASGPEVQINL